METAKRKEERLRQKEQDKFIEKKRKRGQNRKNKGRD